VKTEGTKRHAKTMMSIKTDRAASDCPKLVTPEFSPSTFSISLCDDSVKLGENKDDQISQSI
jgi:hypothetical protein